MTTVPYIPLRHVAAQMGVSLRTVQRWAKSGLRTARLGKTLVTTPEWLDAFASEDPTPEKPTAATESTSRFLAKYGSGAKH